MSTIRLTPKQEVFFKEYVKTGNATAAYRKAYKSNMSQGCISVNAQKVLKNTNVALMIQATRAAQMKRCEITVASQTQKLQDVYEAAFEDKEYAPAISATMGQAKLHGLLVDPGITPATIVNNTQINITTDANELARKVAFMLAKAGQKPKNGIKTISMDEQKNK